MLAWSFLYSTVVAHSVTSREGRIYLTCVLYKAGSVDHIETIQVTAVEVSGNNKLIEWDYVYLRVNVQKHMHSVLAVQTFHMKCYVFCAGSDKNFRFLSFCIILWLPWIVTFNVNNIFQMIHKFHLVWREKYNVYQLLSGTKISEGWTNKSDQNQSWLL